MIRVLIVDDSAFARKVVRECLARDPRIEIVGSARDGLDALEKIAELSPDVVTLDLVMPNLDGIGVLAGLPAGSTARVVLCSTAEDDSAMVVHALSLGAVTFVHKPTALATDRLYEMGRPLIEAVALAAGARVVGVASPSGTPASSRRPVATRLLAIGASTGGPQAISRILRALPADFPVPVAIVVHMPVGYTQGFAMRLDAQCALEVIEAHEGAELRPGRVIIAQAGSHLRIDQSLTAVLDLHPAHVAHRPSVDVLFTSAAAACGSAALGLVLTGMGDDGLLGSRAMVAAGGRVFTQASGSCVVYGMPRVVEEAGLSTGSVELDEIPDAIARAL